MSFRFLIALHNSSSAEKTDGWGKRQQHILNPSESVHHDVSAELFHNLAIHRHGCTVTNEGG